MSKREMDIEKARIYGYKNDQESFTRLVIESKVKMEILSDAYRKGQNQK